MLLHPLIQIYLDGGHFAVTLGLLLSCAMQNVFVNTKDDLVNARMNSIKLDDMYERFDIRPDALSLITRLVKGQRPKLTCRTREL